MKSKRKADVLLVGEQGFLRCLKEKMKV